MEPLQELENEYVERRLAGCVARLTDKAAERRVRDRATLRRRLDYWRQAREHHRAGRFHEGVERIRKDYAKLLKAAIRDGIAVGETVARSEPYLKYLENRRRYEKGRHTSYANRSAAVDDSMKAKRGYKTKRQDGKPMTPEHLADIDAIVTDFEGVVGPLADLLRQTNLTIAHTCGKHPFMQDAGGLYHPSEQSISVGVVVGEPIRAGAHELAHWLDAEAGAALGFTTRIWKSSSSRGYDMTYLSEAEWRTEGDPEWGLLHAASRAMSRTWDVCRMFSTRTKRTVERDRVRASLGPYWSRPREIFARLVEQWLATRLGRQSSAADSPESYESRAGWWTRDDFAKLVPEIDTAVWWRTALLRGEV